MTPYDTRAWEEITKWRQAKLSGEARKVLPQGVRDQAQKLGRRAHRSAAAVPGSAAFEEALSTALSGLSDVASRAGMASVRTGAVVSAFQKAGHEVADIDDVRTVDLKAIDKVRPQLALGYMATATVEGAAAGLAVSGGELAVVGGGIFGAGAGAAPGAGLVVGTLAADAVAVLVGANRAVAHVAAYYGYDVRQPEERLIALGVLGLGTAIGASKAAAYIQLNKLVQQLARRAAWQQLRKSAVTKVVEQVFLRLGVRLTQRKLGQAVPVLGVVIGAGLNATLLRTIVDDAEHVYRERYLRDRYGLEVSMPLADDGDAGIDVLEIFEAEIVDAELVDDDVDDAPAGRP